MFGSQDRRPGIRYQGEDRYPGPLGGTAASGKKTPSVMAAHAAAHLKTIRIARTTIRFQAHD